MTKPSRRLDESKAPSLEPTWFRSVVTLLVLVSAISLWALSYQGAEFVRSLGDRLSPDGDAATFSAERIRVLQIRLRFAGSYLLFIAALTLLPGLRVAPRLWALPGSLPPLLVRAVRRLRVFWVEQRGHALALGVFALVNVTLALSYIEKPITCDEAHTSIHFASKSFSFIVCNYISPNNHVLRRVDDLDPDRSPGVPDFKIAVVRDRETLSRAVRVIENVSAEIHGVTQQLRRRLDFKIAVVRNQ